MEDDERDGEKDIEKPIIIDDEVLEILRQALIEDKKKARGRRDMSGKALNEALYAVVCEFLGCFNLFGYDFDGNLVEIKRSSTKMEKSAMDNLFIQKFGEFMGERSNSKNDKFDF